MRAKRKSFPSLHKIPKELKSLFFRIGEDFPKILGHNLAGIYIYGSLTYGAFNKKSSDADCVVVTGTNLNDDEFQRLAEWFRKMTRVNPWTKKLEMYFFTKKNMLVKKAKAALYHSGKLKRTLTDGNPIIWVNIQKSGLTLYGPSPKTFVPKIKRKIILDAMKVELEYIKGYAKIPNRNFWQQIYEVLTLCRIIYTLKRGKIVSKQEAAKWCIKNSPRKWHRMIQVALKNKDIIDKHEERPDRLLASLLPKFIDYVEKQQY